MTFKAGCARYLVLLIVGSLIGCEAKDAAPPGWVDVCIDADGDGYGFQCTSGSDCDDRDAQSHDDCETSCRSPTTGCACDTASEPVACTLPYQLAASGSLLCSTGTRYCRDGAWSGCEGVKSFEVAPTHTLLTRAIINGDAGDVTCSPCNPDCYQVDHPITLPEGGLPGAVVAGSSGGVTLTSVDADAGAQEPPLLDDVSCTPGVAPDFDCDGVPDSFDPYPHAAPFATDHQTIFMDLGPGESREQPFDIQFFVNTADVYFYLDMTASMEGERDNLITSLTTGNYLPNAGAGIECADRDFDGTPDDTLKNAGIAGNIACLIRDSRLGAGWFRDIPFEGPYANGIRVAPTNFALFEHRQDVTSNVDAVRDALATFETAGNYNAPEGSMQGLWSLVTGQQLYTGWTRPGIPERTGCPAGTWGYACFREEAVPIVVHISDAPLQNGPSPSSSARAGYLTDCVEECSCVRETCWWGYCFCAEQSCSCGNTGRHPLEYDNNVLSGLKGGTEAGYRKLVAGETLGTAEDVGSVDDVLVTYAGSNEAMAHDLTFSTLGNCPSGTSAWSSSSQSAPDAVFRFKVQSTKTLTISTRGSRFDAALLVKRVGSSSALDCNNNLSSTDVNAEITRSFSPGDYYAILKGRTSQDAGWFQITFGDKARQTTGSFAAKTWLGPNHDGAGGVRQALLDRGVRVISVNSSNDAYLAEQTQGMARATNALDIAGNPLTFAINGNGTGMGAAVIDAVNLLAGNLAMDVGVVLREDPDRPLPHFGFVVEAVDQPGDLCDPPIDTDGDAEHKPDTHVNCRPGAAPRFKVLFKNPAAPNHVRPNPADANGGYNMRLELIGDGTYVVDRIPVYIIPEDVVPTPPTTQFAASANYEQTVGALGCAGNEAPRWETLSWEATLPSGTGLRWELCSADSEAALASCTLKTAAEVISSGPCSSDDDCTVGACREDGLCLQVTGPACATQQDCGTGGTCANQQCTWTRSPIDIKAALRSGLQGRDFLRVRTTLIANEERSSAPTLFDWHIDYTCSAQE